MSDENKSDLGTLSDWIMSAPRERPRMEREPLHLKVSELQIVAVVEHNGIKRNIHVGVSIGSPLGQELWPHIEEEVRELIKEGYFDE